MVTENTTPNRGYQEPAVGNTLEVDVGRLIAALRAIDVDVADALAQIVAKAGLASPAFTGTPTAPTAAPGTDSGQLATTAFVKAAVAALVDSAPGALDTLNELAAAIGDDPNFAATMAALIGTKADAAATTAALAGKADAATTIAAGTGLSGGGNLTANRTISADIADQPTAEAGADNTKLMTPQNTRWAIDARAKFVHEYISAPQVITASGALTLAHGLGVPPKFIAPVLICTTAEHGYSIGDIIPANIQTSSSASDLYGVSLEISGSTNILVRFAPGSPGPSRVFLGVHKTSGAVANLTDANWRLIVRAWA